MVAKVASSCWPQAEMRRVLQRSGKITSFHSTPPDFLNFQTSSLQPQLALTQMTSLEACIRFIASTLETQKASQNFFRTCNYTLKDL